MTKLLGRLWDFFHLLSRQPDFTLRLESGQAKLWQGKAPSGFVSDCNDLARNESLEVGLIFGIRRDRGYVLEFSAEVPERYHQTFRNLWQIHSGQN